MFAQTCFPRKTLDDAADAAPDNPNSARGCIPRKWCGDGVAGPRDGFGDGVDSGAAVWAGSGVTGGCGSGVRCGCGWVVFLRCGVGECRAAGFGLGLGFGLGVALSSVSLPRDFRNISFFSSSVIPRSARGASAMLKAAAKMKNLRTVGWGRGLQQARKIQHPFSAVESACACAVIFHRHRRTRAVTQSLQFQSRSRSTFPAGPRNASRAHSQKAA